MALYERKETLYVQGRSNALLQAPRTAMAAFKARVFMVNLAQNVFAASRAPFRRYTGVAIRVHGTCGISNCRTQGLEGMLVPLRAATLQRNVVVSDK